MSTTSIGRPPVTDTYRWYVVGVLLLVFVLSYFDRYILSLVVEPLKNSLQLTDFQVGLLLGPAFSLFHVIMGVPLGWYADRTNRVLLLTIGIVLWCAATTASGFATTFVFLLLLRFGLGLAESVVSPCSVSLISDYFDRLRRPRAISLYMAGPYLGAGLAFLVGGNLIGWLEDVGHNRFLGLGPFESWQMAFFLVGFPGFVFALLMLTVREPARTERIATASGKADVSAFAYILARWRGYLPVFVGATCNFAMSTLTFWNVPLFSRVFGWDVAMTGTVTGLFYFTAGPIGTAIAIWGMKRLGERHSDAALRVLLLGLVIGIPASALYPVMPNAWLAVGVMGVAFAGKSIATAGGPAALQQITPGEIRSRSVAIFNAVITVVGPLLGPPIIGWATDASGDPRSIGVVLCAFVLCLGLPSLFVVALGLKNYRAALAGLESDLVAASRHPAISIG